jgi:hypothetical protein
MKNRRWILGGAGSAALAAPAVVRAPDLFTAAFAQGKPPGWLVPDLLAKAKAEGGTLTVYSSVNEQEALPLWKEFEGPTGIKVDYVRGSDTALVGRIALEARAQQRSWDVLVTTAVGRLPQDFLVPFEPA